jgi:hypothetical protein
MNFSLKISLLFLLSSGILSSNSHFTGAEPVSLDCPGLSVTEVVDILLAEKARPSSGSKCRDGKTLTFFLDDNMESELIFSGNVEYRSKPFGTKDEQYLRYFRKFELELLKRLKKPIFSYKGGNLSGTSSDLYNIARGRVTYQTVWSKEGKRLVLEMKGENYEILLLCYWTKKIIK